MEILINPFGEPSNDWREEERKAKQSLLRRLEGNPDGNIPAEVAIKNIGRGADWHVLSLTILSTATGLFFVIPAAHKKVRESLEEWRRIYNEFSRLLSWLAINSPIYFPDHYLFLVALLNLDEDTEASELEYLGCHPIPEDNPSLEGLEALIFNFKDGDVLESIAISRQGNVMWHNSTPLGAESA
ncbi:hypothetical protein [Reinekea sp. G2M2-21]|uniref:hypothetical protein n=1 Tax=Reinekea sp. G2M2-21 TaxID=2788942 RepID=UPI0018AC191A|nr:hypothetical protein [Reinekea sp. G2M2-21]